MFLELWGRNLKVVGFKIFLNFALWHFCKGARFCYNPHISAILHLIIGILVVCAQIVTTANFWCFKIQVAKVVINWSKNYLMRSPCNGSAPIMGILKVLTIFFNWMDYNIFTNVSIGEGSIPTWWRTQKVIFTSFNLIIFKPKDIFHNIGNNMIWTANAIFKNKQTLNWF